MILFLDYDGVMHPVGCAAEALFRHAERFAAVLRDTPDAKVVVSSSWRKDATPADLIAPFPEDIRSRFIGQIEADIADVPLWRARETLCWTWLATHGRGDERWIAIDDCPDNFGPDLPGNGAVLFTDPSLGFDDDASLVLRDMILTPGMGTRFLYDRAYLRGWGLWD